MLIDLTFSFFNKITEKVNLKRQPAKPREAHFVSTKKNIPMTVTPLPHDTVF